MYYIFDYIPLEVFEIYVGSTDLVLTYWVSCEFDTWVCFEYQHISHNCYIWRCSVINWILPFGKHLILCMISEKNGEIFLNWFFLTKGQNCVIAHTGQQKLLHHHRNYYTKPLTESFVYIFMVPGISKYRYLICEHNIAK